VRPAESLAEHRLLPRAEREQFQYEMVRFHLEDLNAIEERRRARRGRGTPAPDERRRIAAIVQAARWDREGFLTAIRRFTKEGRAQGDDAFAPTLLLLALGVARSWFLSTIAPALRRRAETSLKASTMSAAASPPRRRAKTRK